MFVSVQVPTSKATRHPSKEPKCFVSMKTDSTHAFSDSDLSRHAGW